MSRDGAREVRVNLKLRFGQKILKVQNNVKNFDNCKKGVGEKNECF